ncbi:MAG: hypothetical protein WBD99_16360, partial [Thermodesulfobacteriota bacterium]
IQHDAFSLLGSYPDSKLFIAQRANLFSSPWFHHAVFNRYFNKRLSPYISFPEVINNFGKLLGSSIQFGFIVVIFIHCSELLRL